MGLFPRRRPVLIMAAPSSLFWATAPWGRLLRRVMAVGATSGFFGELAGLGVRRRVDAGVEVRRRLRAVVVGVGSTEAARERRDGGRIEE